MAEMVPIPYARQEVTAADLEAVRAVLESDWLTQGPMLRRFEQELCSRVSAYQPDAPESDAPEEDQLEAVAVSSGSTALELALAGLGIGRGDVVVTSANTFLSTATAAIRCGAEVEFVDTEADGRRVGANLDVDALAQRLAREPTVRAVIAVHYAGRPSAMQELFDLKLRYGFHLVEDACHALGATYEAHGLRWHPGLHPEVDAAAFSFHPAKHVTTGEGGAVLTRSPVLASKVRQLRHHGLDPGSPHQPFPESSERPAWHRPMENLGVNGRMSDVQAALGVSQLARLDAVVERRRYLARRYEELLLGPELPLAEPGHAWHLYPVRVGPELASSRDALMSRLAERGIGTQLHYYPVPYQPWFRRRYGDPHFPRALDHARRSVSLPMFPALTDAEQDRVAAEVNAWFEERRS